MPAKLGGFLFRVVGLTVEGELLGSLVVATVGAVIRITGLRVLRRL